MIDLNLLREKPENIIDLIKRKEPAFDVKQLYDLDMQYAKLRKKSKSLRHRKNELAQARQRWRHR